MDRITGAPLRALARLSGSPITDKLGMRAGAERVVYEAVRAGTKAVTTAAGTVAPPRPTGPAPDAQRLETAKPGGPFDLRPTEEQALMRDAMKRFADEVLRQAARKADDEAAPQADVLAQGHALGLAGIAIPESLGGMATGRSAVTNALVAEELARGDMGLATAVLAPLGVVSAIVAWGSGEQQARHLPAFLEETPLPAAMALVEPRPMFDPMHLRTGAVRAKEGGWALFGDKSLVPLAATARLFLVAADVRGLGPRLFLVEAGTPGLTVEPEPSMGVRGAGLGRLHLEDVRVPDGAILGGPDAAAAFDLGELVDRARVTWGAMAVGTSQAVLDYVVPYVNSRVAFGEPISNRQAVAFMVADVATELEGMRLLVHRAASRIDAGLDVARQATLARIQCASKGMKIGSDGVQLLGGHGFIKEHPVERWYRDLRAVGVMEGGLL